MSCFPEYRYAIYVDGELEGEALREVREHLVGCQPCRELVVALEEEAALLGDVLHDRQAAWRNALPARQRARGVAVGLAPALGAAALVVTLGGALLERRLPAGTGWLSPLEFIGATEMLFDTIFLVRDGASQWFDLAVATGGLAAFAALGTFLTGLLTRRLSGGLAPSLLGLAGLAIGLTAAPAGAIDFRHEKGDIRIGPNEVVGETLIASGDAITVDGTVDGDLVVLAERFVLTGKVTGNVFAGAREVELRGEVEGSAHVGGERVTIEGNVARTLYGGAETLTLRANGAVGRDAVLGAEQVRLEGRTGRDLTAFGDDVQIFGTVARDANTWSEALVVHEEARIGRDLDVKMPDGEEAEIRDETVIGGEIRRGTFDDEEERGRWTNPHFYLEAFVFLVSAFLLGMGLHWTVPRIYDAEVSTAPAFFRCIGLGFVGLIATPVVLVLCFVTIVGIPIGVIGLFSFLTALFVALILVAALVGSAVLDRETESAWAFGSALLLGLVIVVVAANLPFLGGLIRILVLLEGLGLLLTSLYTAWQGRGGHPA